MTAVPDALTAESLICDLRQRRGVNCPVTGAALNDHTVLMNLALGFRDAPRSLPALATGLGSTPQALRDQLFAYIQQRDCFRGAWEWAAKEAQLASGEIATSSGTTGS